MGTHLDDLLLVDEILVFLRSDLPANRDVARLEMNALV
jgi:hypothetical protein